MTNEIDWQTADLNEAGEWVEVPAESLLPKWLLRSDEDEEIHFVVPYLEEEFCQWLMKKQGLEKETASRYVQSYMSVYDSLHEQIGLDLYGLLYSYLVKIPKRTKCDITKEVALFLVRVYIDVMHEILEEHPDAYTSREKHILFVYHDFIADLAGMPEEKLLKEKAIPLQEEDK